LYDSLSTLASIFALLSSKGFSCHCILAIFYTDFHENFGDSTLNGQRCLAMFINEHFLAERKPGVWGKSLTKIRTKEKHRPAGRAEPTKCWFVSKRKQARRAWMQGNSKLQQNRETVTNAEIWPTEKATNTLTCDQALFSFRWVKHSSDQRKRIWERC